MTVPRCVTETLAAMQAERVPLAARLDAIELAESNLKRIWAPDDALDRRVPARRAAPERRKATRAVTVEPAAESSDAADRRELLLRVIGRSEVGCTIADLRKATPKMEGQDRSNALSVLKAKGEIRRAGNAWVKA